MKYVDNFIFLYLFDLRRYVCGFPLMFNITFLKSILLFLIFLIIKLLNYISSHEPNFLICFWKVL